MTSVLKGEADNKLRECDRDNKVGEGNENISQFFGTPGMNDPLIIAPNRHHKSSLNIFGEKSYPHSSWGVFRSEGVYHEICWLGIDLWTLNIMKI